MDFAWNKCVFLEKILELCIVWWGTTSNQDKMRDRLSGQFFCYFFAEYNYIIFFIWTSFIHANCHLTTYFVAALVVLHILQIIRFHWRRWKCQGQTLSRKFWNHFLHIDYFQYWIVHLLYLVKISAARLNWNRAMWLVLYVFVLQCSEPLPKCLWVELFLIQPEITMSIS